MQIKNLKIYILFGVLAIYILYGNIQFFAVIRFNDINFQLPLWNLIYLSILIVLGLSSLLLFIWKKIIAVKLMVFWFIGQLFYITNSSYDIVNKTAQQTYIFYTNSSLALAFNIGIKDSLYENNYYNLHFNFIPLIGAVIAGLLTKAVVDKLNKNQENTTFRSTRPATSSPRGPVN